MAFDVKGTFAKAFLELCETKELSKITVKDLEEKTGFSRPTFYRHFKDRDDLVQYIYDTKIIPRPVRGAERAYMVQDSHSAGDMDVENIYEWMTEHLRLIKKYKRFMKMALTTMGPNSLFVHMISESRKSDLEWHKMMCGDNFTGEMAEVTDYHTAASVYITMEWVLMDMPLSEEELADKIIRSRVTNLPEVLGIKDENNIYLKMRRKLEQK